MALGQEQPPAGLLSLAALLLTSMQQATDSAPPSRSLSPTRSLSTRMHNARRPGLPLLAVVGLTAARPHQPLLFRRSHPPA